MSDLLMSMPIPYTPKLKNRWVINFKGNYEAIPKWVLSKTTRPKWVDGCWVNLEIFLRDPISTSTSKILMDAFRMSGKKKKIKYDLELLDPTGITIEKWKIKGIIQEIDFGELDYSKDSLVEVRLTIRPTKVILVY